MHPLLDFSLAQLPGLYGRLIGLRSRPNLEKIVYLQLVRRLDVVVELGAHTGYYTALFSHLVGRRGLVHAFEPVPPTMTRLRDHLDRAGRYDNVILHQLAVADREGETQLLVPGDDFGQASLRRLSGGSWLAAPQVHAFRARSVTLDGFFAAHPTDRWDFLKCDIEGAELAALEGGRAALRRFQPVIHLEVCPDWTARFGYAPEELARLLRELGYVTFLLVGEGVALLHDPEAALAGVSGSPNLLCATSGRSATLLSRLRRWARSA